MDKAKVHIDQPLHTFLCTDVFLDNGCCEPILVFTWSNRVLETFHGGAYDGVFGDSSFVLIFPRVESA